MANMSWYPTYVKKIPKKGWGAFCVKRIPKGTFFNVTTLLVLTPREAKAMSGSSLEPYWYQFGERGRAIALGLGSIMNHSDEANCSYRFHKKGKTLHFYALRDIPAHQELTHDYGWTSQAYRDFGILRNLPGKKRKKRKTRGTKKSSRSRRNSPRRRA